MEQNKRMATTKTYKRTMRCDGGKNQIGKWNGVQPDDGAFRDVCLLVYGLWMEKHRLC